MFKKNVDNMLIFSDKLFLMDHKYLGTSVKTM